MHHPRQSKAFTGQSVQAVLGPTNTGKTHLAIERMCAHRNGVIGLPLRLLAREVYSRVVEKVGVDNVALVTGEEKIVPKAARYSVCTVEAMPRDAKVEFVAIDEVQLAGDFERGHIFTDRILNVRGIEETLLLGAATAAPILQKLLPDLSVTTRPRMSHLAYAGAKKITRLPRRSAIVAFSADEVYAIAELVRRQRGGAAVVMGSLSPRTRNAQVELYQNGEVDYLIATDAIGMGLNLDVDHVAFAQSRKFDGRQFRDLSPVEMAQIAGRAGRHIKDGTFGVSGQVAPLHDDLVQQIESHDFAPLEVLQWRAREFDFSSIEALKRSLDVTPGKSGLTRALPAVDQRALEFLSRDMAVVDLCQTAQDVETLWQTCTLPDYRKIAPAQHADIISSIYFDLCKIGHVNEDYMAQQVQRADRIDGEIDTLSHRIAQIRTWTYVSNRPNWLADPAHWQEKTREIEDKLSDALHERLTKRFVDRRTSVLMKRLRENENMDAEISAEGDVTVEGHHVGQLEAFRFTADNSAEGEDAKAIRAAAAKALATEFETRAERFGACPNGDLAISSDGTLRWLGSTIATLTASDDWLKPRLVMLADEQLTGPALDKVRARAERFVTFHIETHLKPLTDLQKADELSGIARGIAFQLIEHQGIVERRSIANDMKSLDQDGRAALRRHGVRFGFYNIFIPALIKPAPAGLLTLLWSISNDSKDKAGYGEVVTLLASGRTSLVTDTSFEGVFYKLAGYRLLGPRAVRVDILERLADLIRPTIHWKAGTELPEGAFGGGKFIVTPAMMSILGATADDMEAVLKGLGYKHEPMDAEKAAQILADLQAEHAPKPAEETPVVEAAEPKVEEAKAEDTPAEDSEAEKTSEAPSEEPSEIAKETSAPVESEDNNQTETSQEPPKPVLVWHQVRFERSANRGNRSQPGERQNKRKGGDKARGNFKGKGKPGGNRPQNTNVAAPRKEKKADPDSPFAKLQALKEQLGK